MEQITAMKITGITFTDFRNHKAPESYTFGDISYITGHNVGNAIQRMAFAMRCMAFPTMGSRKLNG